MLLLNENNTPEEQNSHQPWWTTQFAGIDCQRLFGSLSEPLILQIQMKVYYQELNSDLADALCDACSSFRLRIHRSNAPLPLSETPGCSIVWLHWYNSITLSHVQLSTRYKPKNKCNVCTCVFPTNLHIWTDSRWPTARRPPVCVPAYVEVVFDKHV